MQRVKDEQKNYFINSLGYVQPDKFETSFDKDDHNSKARVDMEIEKIPDFSAGSKMFLNPRIYKIWKNALPKTEKRTQDFYFPFPMVKIDTTTYLLPEGFTVETLPKPRQLNFEFGSFTSGYRFDESHRTIVSTARLLLNEFRIPAAKYAATEKFFNDVMAEFGEKIVIRHL